jgi:hypothetical protein
MIKILLVVKTLVWKKRVVNCKKIAARRRKFANSATWPLTGNKVAAAKGCGGVPGFCC